MWRREKLPFSLFIDEKFSQLDRRTGALVEKRSYDVVVEMEMNRPHFSSENAGQIILYDGNLNKPMNNEHFISYLQS